MSIKVKFPALLHPSLRSSGLSYKTVEVSGHTIGECVDQLEARFPGIKRGLCDEKGQLKLYYDIYVNSASSYPEELAKPVKDGDELVIVIIAAGG